MKKTTAGLRLIILLATLLAVGGSIVCPQLTASVSAGPPERRSSSPSPELGGFRIGIQAGHGRGDVGASSCDGTIHEADITAAVARKVVTKLRRYGARADLFTGEDPGLRGYKADAFVALHTDYCPDRENPSRPSGYKVARYGGAPGSGLDGSGDASDQLVKALWEEYGRGTGLPQDRSPGHFTPSMLHYYALGQVDSSTPGAIVEMGWLSGDLDVLVNHQDRLAEGIATSLVRFLGGRSNPQTPPAVPQGGQSATVLLVDVSGSMNETWRGGVKIESARRAARDVINMVEQESQIGETDHQVAVASFTDNATLDLALTDDYPAAHQVVSGLQALSQTNMGAGLQVANRALESAPAGAKKIIILLSDGLTNEGMSPAQILASPVQDSAAAGTCIYTVGFGEPGNLDEQLLREVAAGAACGEYHYASAPTHLEQVYIRLRHESMGTVVAEFEGQVTQGETVQAGEVEVPRNQGQMNVTLHWPGSDLDLIVTDPRGRRVSETDPGVSLVKHGNMIYLIVENPRPGRWLLGVLGTDVPEGTLDYDAIVSVRERTGTPALNVGRVILGIGLAVVVVSGVVFAATRTRRAGASSAGVTVVEGHASRSPVYFRRRLIIGRHPRCDLALSDPQVSARHAAIERTRHGYVVTDLNSKNGTFVNGKRVPQVLLQGGEQLRLGQTKLVFNAGGPGGAARSAPRSSGAPSASLAILVEDEEFARYPVSAGSVIGRHEGCSVDLRSDALVSRRHARLDYRDGRWIITDLDSGNRTFVNGRPVRSQALRNGDHIQLGNTRMRFYVS